MNQSFVFDETKWAINSLELSIQEFMFALVGSWNLRCDIEGMLQSYPEISRKQLAERYAVGSGVVGCDFKSGVLSSKWVNQRSSLSWMLLNSTCAIFESWIERLLGSNSVLPLQQPEAARKHLEAEIRHDCCKDMQDAFFESYCDNPKYSGPHLEAYLKCYQLFKVLRNAYMHTGRVATQRCIEVYDEFLESCTKESMGGQTVPKVTCPVLNEPVVLDYRGIIGFTNIVIRLLRTYDIMLLPTHRAKDAFVNKVRLLDIKTRDFSQLGESRAKKKMCAVLAQARVSPPKGMKAARRIFEESKVFKFGKPW